ncbi:MAG TPA: protein kinase [Kofleriaceae bacterium]|nr:protein kinase [Kofleriaceae bacterium]
MTERDPGIDPLSPTVAPDPDDGGSDDPPSSLPAGSEPRSAGARSLSPTGDLCGRRLAHFQIEKRLGRGGMGEVYLATDLSLDRPVAIKVLAHDIANDSELRERFDREAHAQARVQHPHVCHIYYVGEEDGQRFFAMEYIDGESLQQRLDREGKLPPQEAMELCRMAALGLREAHRRGFCHRDIKPSNLMVDGNGQLKIVDFGIAKQSGAGAAPALTKKGSNTIFGTPLYMAPEQAKGQPIDFRTDIYSLGATLHHLIAGAPPFDGESNIEVIAQHLSEPRPRIKPPRRFGREPEAVDALCDQMMAKRPDDRFASYDDLIAAMDQASPVRSRRAGFWMRAAATLLDLTIVLLTMAFAKIPVTKNFDTRAWNQLIDAAAMTAYLGICVLVWKNTLGKRLLGLEPVSTGGSPPTRLAMMARCVTKWGLWVAVGAALSLLWITGGTPPPMWWEVAYVASLVLPTFAGIFAVWRSPGKRTVWDRLARTEVRRKASGP